MKFSADTDTRAMNIIGTVESVGCYPVKSMRGKELDETLV
jgi:hypothetical protein